jgi:hypothetical protein
VAEAPVAAATDASQELTPAAHLASKQAEGFRAMDEVFQRPGIVVRWPLYLRQVKQILRTADESFDERRYGFTGLVEALRYAQREGLFRLDRDRQGVLRVYPGTRLQRAAPAQTGADGGAVEEGGVEPRTAESQVPEPAPGDLFGEPRAAAGEAAAPDVDSAETASEEGTLQAAAPENAGVAEPAPEVEVARAPRRRSTKKAAHPPARKNASSQGRSRGKPQSGSSRGRRPNKTAAD